MEANTLTLKHEETRSGHHQSLRLEGREPGFILCAPFHRALHAVVSVSDIHLYFLLLHKAELLPPHLCVFDGLSLRSTL